MLHGIYGTPVAGAHEDSTKFMINLLTGAGARYLYHQKEVYSVPVKSARSWSDAQEYPKPYHCMHSKFNAVTT
eukprot:SAG31_NODE_4339_length_3340_cov_4.899389_1_plen_73_part_00